MAHRAAIRPIALLLALAAWLALPLATLAQTGPDLGVVSKRYIVVDARTGEIYAERGMHDRVAPASLTKIFTAIEAIESAPGSYQVVTTESDLVDWEATQVGFGPGEVFTLTDMIHGMMVPSGNDAARAVARALGAQDGDGAEQAMARFMERTNARVQAMGLADTALVNPDGWGVDGHVSSAYDVAAFTMYAMKYPRFMEAISAEEYTTSTGGYELVNTNKKMDEYDDLLGGKTGYDDTAGYCLMQIARRGDDTMIAVTLDGVAPDVWYEDNRTLLDYGFEQAAARRAAGGQPLGPVVRYLDPDAAVIQQLASGSAALGQTARISPAEAARIAEASADTAPSGDAAAPVVAPDVAAAGARGGRNGLLLAALVALAIIGVRTVSSWRDRHPGTLAGD